MKLISCSFWHTCSRRSLKCDGVYCNATAAANLLDAPLIQIRYVPEHAAGAATVHHEDVNDDDIARLVKQPAQK